MLPSLNPNQIHLYCKNDQRPCLSDHTVGCCLQRQYRVCVKEAASGGTAHSQQIWSSRCAFLFNIHNPKPILFSLEKVTIPQGSGWSHFFFCFITWGQPKGLILWEIEPGNLYLMFSISSSWFFFRKKACYPNLTTESQEWRKEIVIFIRANLVQKL